MSGSCLLLYPTTAQALTLGEVVVSIGESPWAVFGMGCAVGAIVAGLIVGLVGRSRRTRLEEQLIEAATAYARAEGAALRAEAILAKHKANAANDVVAEIDDKDVVEPLAQQVELEEAQQEADEDLVQPLTTEDAPMEVAWEGSSVEETSEEVVSETAPEPVEQSSSRGVRAVLKERLGASFENFPNIERGATRPASVGFRIAPMGYAKRVDAATRVAIIDRRIPRFDESLFPDITNQVIEPIDPFADGLKAMERTMPPIGGVDDDPTLDLGSSVAQRAAVTQSDEPDFSNPESYVNYLVQDELERNRSGSARRFSRSQLTVFEGTGDLNALRRKGAYKARHLSPTSREA